MADHRAKQIADGIVTALQSVATLNSVVYRHRALTLSEAEQELPAACVQIGVDTPTNRTFASLDSQLEVIVKLYCVGSTEADVFEQLMNMRTQSHVAVMTNPAYGLTFVTSTIYAGADAPQIRTEGGRLVGVLETRWTVDYRMNLTDPS